MRLQPQRRVLIALPIALDLVRPVPVIVEPRPNAVERATVPEAAVYEDGDPLPREDQIGPSPEPAKRGGVDSIAVPSTVKGPP